MPTRELLPACSWSGNTRKHEEREAAYIANTQRKRADNGVDAFVGPPRCGTSTFELLPCSAVCLLICPAPRLARCHALHGMLELLETSLHRSLKGERACRLVLRHQLGGITGAYWVTWLLACSYQNHRFHITTESDPLTSRLSHGLAGNQDTEPQPREAQDASDLHVV